MILSQYVIVRHITGRAFSDGERRDIIRHYEVTRTSQGGWGLHAEDDAQVFTTALGYVALRLTGLEPEAELDGSPLVVSSSESLPQATSIAASIKKVALRVGITSPLSNGPMTRSAE